MLVLCCGMIRSGSTLQYNLARTLIEEAGRGETVGWASERGGHLSREEIEQLAASDRMKVVKSHDLLGIDRNPLPEGSFILCYSYRDIRDVAGSARQHFSYEGETLFENIRENLRVFDMVERMPMCITQSYELLTERGDDAAHQLNEHLQLGLTRDQTDEVAARWSRERVEAEGIARDKSTIKRIRDRLLSTQIGPAIQRSYRLLPKSVRKRVNRVHRDDSLLHEGHISENTRKGVPSRANLSEHELEHVTEIGRDWLAARGYPM